MVTLTGLGLRILFYYIFIMSISSLLELDTDSDNALICSTALSMLYIPLVIFFDKKINVVKKSNE